MGHHRVLRRAGIFFIGGCFFKYPDGKEQESPSPPSIRRYGWWPGNGKIKEVHRKDRDSVWSSDVIAVLENPAVTEDVMLLKERLYFRPGRQQHSQPALSGRGCL